MANRVPRTLSPARLVFVGGSVGLGALAVHSGLQGELGLARIGALTAGWYALATPGVLFPHLEMYGPIVSSGPSGRRRVALTFDDGPDPVSTRRVLDALRGTPHRATFFVLGAKARLHPDVVRDIHAAGHSLGVHGDVHDRLHSFRMPRTVREQLLRAVEAVEAATGVRPYLFRPPLGHTSVTTMRGARLAGVTVVSWSLRGYDGMRSQTPEAVVERIERDLTDGAIVMLHDAAERDDFEPAAVRALPQLLAALDRRGLTSVGVDTLLGTPAEEVKHAS